MKPLKTLQSTKTITVNSINEVKVIKCQLWEYRTHWSIIQYDINNESNRGVNTGNERYIRNLWKQLNDSKSLNIAI